MIYPTKFVDWKEVSEWSWHLAQKIKESEWSPDVVVAVGRGCFVVSRLLCELPGAERLLTTFVKRYEREKSKASKSGSLPDKGIAAVVNKLEARIEVEQKVDLKGQKALLVEEIVATGMHFKLSKEIIEKRWKAEEIKTATLVWKAPTIITPDYYVVKPGKFVWFQFPWSRLSDYVQFLRVMLTEESGESGKAIWSEDEIQEKFMSWYGARPEMRYLREALNLLRRNGIIKLVSEGKISVTLPRV